MQNITPPVLFAEREVPLDKAMKMAEKLAIKLVSHPERYKKLFYLSQEKLELKYIQNHEQKPQRLSIDFTSGKQSYRNRHPEKELLIRAVRINKKMPEKIIDATGGFGRDAFILASAGCKVDIFEYNPYVAALLEDGLIRAAQNAQTALICERIKLYITNAISALRNSDLQAQVIYLDPMFPKRNKTAKVKLEAQLLQLLAEQKSDTKQLFHAAWCNLPIKIVVKRPAKEKPLCNITPSYTVKGKAIRFDVYMLQSYPGNPLEDTA